MPVFKECPVCGETATVVPELGTEEHKVFKCANDHQFTTNQKSPPDDDEEVWDHLPEWARMFKRI